MRRYLFCLKLLNPDLGIILFQRLFEDSNSIYFI